MMVTMGVQQGDSGQWSKLARLIICWRSFFVTAFIRAVIFKRGPGEEAFFLCDMHSLMSVGLLLRLFMKDFLPGCLFAVVI